MCITEWMIPCPGSYEVEIAVEKITIYITRY
jgi:hypothetical protein